MRRSQIRNRPCLATAGLSLALLLAAAQHPAGAFEGPAGVIDGDGLWVGTVEVRLFGADAYEWSQACEDGWQAGAAATAFLRELTAGRAVRCQATGSSFDRIVARCRAGGVDLSEALLEAGLAVVWPGIEGDHPILYRRLLAIEAAARDAGRGAHGHACATPWDWRRAHAD